MAENRPYYDQIADQCYERAQHFDIKNMVDAYEDVYNQL